MALHSAYVEDLTIAFSLRHVQEIIFLPMKTKQSLVDFSIIDKCYSLYKEKWVSVNFCSQGMNLTVWHAIVKANSRHKFMK